ncbi:MAG: hypothetical protein IJX26_04555 [Clostridia bacterium]|nr:hypothetical protein [Clostridia bacterium]
MKTYSEVVESVAPQGESSVDDDRVKRVFLDRKNIVDQIIENEKRRFNYGVGEPITIKQEIDALKAQSREMAEVYQKGASACLDYFANEERNRHIYHRELLSIGMSKARRSYSNLLQEEANASFIKRMLNRFIGKDFDSEKQRLASQQEKAENVYEMYCRYVYKEYDSLKPETQRRYSLLVAEVINKRLFDKNENLISYKDYYDYIETEKIEKMLFGNVLATRANEDVRTNELITTSV